MAHAHLCTDLSSMMQQFCSSIYIQRDTAECRCHGRGCAAQMPCKLCSPHVHCLSGANCTGIQITLGRILSSVANNLLLLLLVSFVASYYEWGAPIAMAMALPLSLSSVIPLPSSPCSRSSFYSFNSTFFPLCVYVVAGWLLLLLPSATSLLPMVAPFSACSSSSCTHLECSYRVSISPQFLSRFV
eukprot:c23773_g2_i1 orf=498-1055(-)